MESSSSSAHCSLFWSWPLPFNHLHGYSRSTMSVHWNTALSVTADGVGTPPPITQGALVLELETAEWFMQFLSGAVFNTQNVSIIEDHVFCHLDWESTENKGAEGEMSQSLRKGQRQEVRSTLDVYVPATILPLGFIQYLWIFRSLSFCFLICLSKISWISVACDQSLRNTSLLSDYTLPGDSDSMLLQPSV